MRTVRRRFLIPLLATMLLPACTQVPGSARHAALDENDAARLTAGLSPRRHSPAKDVRSKPEILAGNESDADEQVAKRRRTLPIRPVAGLDDEPQELVAFEESDPKVIPPVPAGESGSYTLAQIEQLALENNPALAQMQARASAGYGRQIQAGLYPNPKAGYMGSEIGSDGTAGQQGAFVEQEFVRGGKLALSRNVAGWDAQRLGWEAEVQKYRVLTSVRQSFYEVLIAQKQVELAQQILVTSETGLRVTERDFKGGQVNEIDLRQARVERNNARFLVEKSKNHYRAAWTRLATHLGTPRMLPVSLAGEIEVPPKEISADEALAQVFSNSPELEAARAKIARAQAAIERARVEPTPNVEVQAGMMYDYSSNEPMGQLQIGMPFPIFNRNQGNIQAAECELVAAHRDLERLQLELENRLASVLERYRNAQVQLEIYRGEILPDVRRSLELVTKGYDQQELDYLRYLTAQRTNFQTNVDYLAALQEWWGARLEIEGALLVDGLTGPAGE